jgi:hypothetical protein
MVCAGMLARAPGLRIELLDFPSVAECARSTFQTLGESWRDRWAGDFYCLRRLRIIEVVVEYS